MKKAIANLLPPLSEELPLHGVRGLSKERLCLFRNSELSLNYKCIGYHRNLKQVHCKYAIIFLAF